MGFASATSVPHRVTATPCGNTGRYWSPALRHPLWLKAQSRIPGIP